MADGLTKPLLGASFVRFVSGLSLHGSWLNNQIERSTSSKKCWSFATQKSHSIEVVQDSCSDNPGGIGPQLIAAGALLIRGLSSILRSCGHILITIGAMMIEESENRNLDDQRGEEIGQTGVRRVWSGDVNPRICAFRAPDSHQDQFPIRPSRTPLESQARQRGYAVGSTDVNEVSSQKREVRDSALSLPPLWSHPALQNAPSGKDRWMFLDDRWLVRAHGETRRRSLQPIHRSCPVKAEQINSARHTLVYPMQDLSYANRQYRADTWTSMDMWSKDYLWKGYTIFELKTQPHDEKSVSGSRDDLLGGSQEEPPIGRQSVQVEGGTSQPSSSFASQEQIPYVKESPTINVTVNVNVAGGATSSFSDLPKKQAPSSHVSADSEFEMVLEE